MSIVWRQQEEVLIQIGDNYDANGGDITFRPPFRCSVVGFRVVATDAIDTNDLVAHIRNSSGEAVTETITMAATSAAGTVRGGSAKNLVGKWQFDKGDALIFDIAPTVPAATSTIDVYVLLKKLETGEIHEGVLRA